MSRYTFALLSAVGFGVAPVLARQGALWGLPSILGTTWSTLCALPFLYLFMCVGRRRLTFTKWPRRTQAYVLGTGLCSSIGVLFYWLALSRESVAVVVSINSAFPLLTILLSAILLRQDERITLRLVLGALLVVAGVVIVTT
ncbi:MAG: EamA family transporter [Candidatus Tectomicrobia bacterium]|nr:EamA family transporter [Candidatus Tectomicrobia bacterium]